MDIPQLIYFVSAVESRTLADAAEKLNVSPSTLSQSIKRLEAEFGAELFHRIGRKDEITPVGKVLYDGAVPLLAGFDELRHKVLLEKDEGQNVLTIAMDAVDIGMESIIALSNREKDLRCDPVRGPYQTLHEMLLTRNADFYLTFHKIESAGVTSELLFTEPMQLLVRSTASLAARESVSLAELKDETMLMMETKYAIRQLFDSFFRTAGVQPRMVRIVSSQELMAQYVKADLGCTFIPECIHNAQYAHPESITHVQNTTAVPIDEDFCRRDVYICYLNEKSMPEKQQRYLQFMRDYAAYIRENKNLPYIG